MKITAFILSVIVLVLSCMACADHNHLILKSGKNQEITRTTQQSHNDIDDCSPFCHCACCAGFSLNHTVAVISTPDILSLITTRGFLPSEVIEIALPVWQPPQIA